VLGVAGVVEAAAWVRAAASATADDWWPGSLAGSAVVVLARAREVSRQPVGGPDDVAEHEQGGLGASVRSRRPLHAARGTGPGGFLSGEVLWPPQLEFQGGAPD
jgi:hypothetical protein